MGKHYDKALLFTEPENGLHMIEFRILQFICQGKRVPEISQLLNMKEDAIYAHLFRARRRMGASNNVQLAIDLMRGAVQAAP